MARLSCCDSGIKQTIETLSEGDGESMLERVISGGQTGADQAALRAARACGIPTGGWAARGWLTEDGPAPWLAEWGLAECPDGESEAERYRARR